MAERVTAAEPEVDVGGELAARRAQLRGRLGMNVPKDWWPTIPMLKSFEAAGFAWIQVHAPPAAILRDDVRAVAHAHALRELLDETDLRLVLHGPDELRAGSPGHDRALEGLLAYAKIARAEHVVYHAANVPATGHMALNGGGPLEAEERSLRRLVPLAETLGITLALENLAPVHPGPARESHTPSVVADLVRRLDSPAVRMCLDVGHAHIVAGLRGVDISRLLSPVLDTVGLFHLHDNLGARSRGERAPGVDPLRLDLHLAPGAGTLPWSRVVAPMLERMSSPLLLEIHPPHRPDALSVAEVTGEVLLRRWAAAEPLL